MLVICTQLLRRREVLVTVETCEVVHGFEDGLLEVCETHRQGEDPEPGREDRSRQEVLDMGVPPSGSHHGWSGELEVDERLGGMMGT